METSFLVPGPLNLAETLSRYRLWGEDPANQLVDSAFWRAVKVDGRWCGYRVTWAADDRDGVRLTISVPGARQVSALDAAVRDARHVCGLDLDLPSFYRAVAADNVLGGLTSRLYGLRPTLSPRPFEMLVGSVCAQQVNLAFAFTVRGRLVRRYGVPVGVDGRTV